MPIVAYVAIAIISVFASIIIVLLGTLLACSLRRLDGTNKQLMILVAGEKSAKPELLRALVASQKPPQKTIPGIANDKPKVDKKTGNNNYTLEVGESNIGV